MKGKKLLVLLMIVSLILPSTIYGAGETDRNLVEYLGSDAYTVEKKDEDKIVVSFDEEKFIRAINNLKGKGAGLGDRKSDIIVELKSLEGFNIDFIFPAKIIGALESSKIDLEIRGEESSIYLKHGNFIKSNVGNADLVKIRIDKIANREAVDKVRDQDAMRQAFDFHIDIVRGSSKISLKELIKPLEIQVGLKDFWEEDLLAFYRIEEGMEFITGKIKNRKINYRLHKDGEYALVETHFAFKDTRKHWAKNEIKSMTAKSVVNGLGNNMFKPNENVKREEFAKMLVSSLEINLDNYEYTGEFKDVKEGYWAEPYITAAYKLGLIKGRGKNIFKPEDEITRQEMAVMIARLDKTELTEEEIEAELSKYEDRDTIANWARHDMAKVSKLGIMNGKKSGIDPESQATRGESATIIFRIYNRY